jgi:hypothetical protein
MGKWTETIEVVDAALVPNLRTKRNVFDQPEIHTAAEVEPGLKRGALPEVKAVASGRKRVHPPAALIAEEMVGPIG